MIEFVDLGRQYRKYKDEIDAAVKGALDKHEFILGDEVKNFEEDFADFCEAKHCVGVASGTDALFLSLHALGVGAGDEVITTPHSFVSTSTSISMLGATPVFSDIDPKTFNIDPKKIEASITPRTKVILPVHLYGQPADMDEIKSIAQKHNLKILEDACQAHGARHKGRRVGGLGDIAVFSFYPSKNLGAYGDGGAVVTNSDELAGKVRFLRDFGRTQKDLFQIIGFNSRLDTIQAAILRVKLKHLEEWGEKRRKNAELYNKLLGGTSVAIPTVADYAEPVFHQYVIRVRDRNALMEYLGEKKIPTLVHYPVPIHLQPVYKGLGHKKGDFPAAESAVDEILSLPIFPELEEEEIKYIAGSIIEFYKEGRE